MTSVWVSVSARDPEGHWLGWTPGKQPTLRDKAHAWPLIPGTDLVDRSSHAANRQTRTDSL